MYVCAFHLHAHNAAKPLMGKVQEQQLCAHRLVAYIYLFICICIKVFDENLRHADLKLRFRADIIFYTLVIFD